MLYLLEFVITRRFKLNEGLPTQISLYNDSYPNT
jgi:hypothetical protein